MPEEDAGGDLELPTMKLLSPGQAPRRALRYAWHPGQRERLSVKLRTGVLREIGDASAEIPMPRVTLGLELQPRAVTPEGDLTYGWRVASTDTEPADDDLGTMLTAIGHLSGTATVTSRGMTRRLAVEPLERERAEAGAQMIDRVREILEELVAPLPEEAVGLGARWQRTSRLRTGADVTQVETFTLGKLGPDGGSVSDTLGQSGAPQVLREHAGTAGAPARMDSMRTTGKGTARFDLSRLVPESTFDGATTMVVSRHSDAGDRPVTLVIHSSVAISGSPL